MLDFGDRLEEWVGLEFRLSLSFNIQLGLHLLRFVMTEQINKIIS